MSGARTADKKVIFFMIIVPRFFIISLGQYMDVKLLLLVISGQF